jgi:hypothetical protein
MGDRAQQAYEDDRRQAYRRMPLRYRAEATLKALAFTCATAFLIFLAFIYPAVSQECDPNYDPCVPVASDVDCAGGSGNGPAYVVGSVRVIGDDIYGLDRGGDGIGCD